jgi:hypothetical protein
MSRWWYEVHSTTPGEDCVTTWAYIDGGSGGSFWFRKCIAEASKAADHFAYEYKDEPPATDERGEG